MKKLLVAILALTAVTAFADNGECGKKIRESRC